VINAALATAVASNGVYHMTETPTEVQHQR
jgi:hypothetical protein